MVSCTCVGLTVAFIAVVLKIYIKLNTKWNNCFTCLLGKTAIITGANAGVGYETAVDLAMRGARVILACRSKQRADEAREKIVEITGNNNVVVKLVDTQSFKSIREFCKDINENEERVDILVNNAGAAYLDNVKTEDDCQILMQTNYFGPFLLTHLLIEKLKKSAPSRIVNVSSYFAKFANITAETLNEFPKGAESHAKNMVYNNTKLCNLVFSIELARKLEGTGVLVFAAHPGATITDLTRNLPGLIQTIFTTLRSFYFWTQTEGAQCQIYCAVSKDIENRHGEFFGNCRPIPYYEKANDVVFRKAVWTRSEELTKLSQSEKL